MARRRRGREVNGVVVLDKPAGWSSNDAVQQAKRLFHAAKVGHTGSLDPLATGVLPLCFGEATKFSQFLLDSDKRYLTKVRLGIATDSGDSDGEVLAERQVEGIDQGCIDDALNAFRGAIEQVPSMFSAVKHKGQPLYKLARQGIVVEREARPVTIYRNDLVDFDGERLTLDIHCSKGTYVRTIAHDLGEALGCGAHVYELRRLAAGPYTEADAIQIEQLQRLREQGDVDSALLPIASAVQHWPALALTGALAFYVRQGQPVLVPHSPASGWVRLYEASTPPAAATAWDDEDFIGVGEILDDGRVAPRRLIVAAGRAAVGAGSQL